MPWGDGFQIVCGHTRFKAMTEILGCTELEVGKDIIVREMDESTALRVMVDDNIKRRQYNPAEFAEALKLLINTCKLSIREVARQYDVAASWLDEIIKISELPDRVKAKVVWGRARAISASTNGNTSAGRQGGSVRLSERSSGKGEITVSHAKKLQRLETNGQKVAVARAIEKHNLTADETGAVVNMINREPWGSVDEAVHVMRSGHAAGALSSLTVEFGDSRVAEALARAAEAAETSPKEYAAVKITEGLVNDGYLRPEVLRQDEVLKFVEEKLGTAATAGLSAPHLKGRDGNWPCLSVLNKQT
jgi:hypothetical protein